VLKEWRRGQKIVLAANPDYRDVRFPGNIDPADRAIVKAMHGKRLPQVGRIEINVIEESNPRLQAFERGDLDYISVPNDVATSVLGPGTQLKPRFTAAHVHLARGVQPSIVYTYFNMENPLVGGYTREKVALRRAIGMAYNNEEEIRVLRLGNALPATQPIPPGVSGHDAAFDGRGNYDPAGAARCSTSSAMSIATVTAGATFPTASRWCCGSGSRHRPTSVRISNCGSAASRRWVSGWTW
jgi:oligopeptide transport system substrate-binding protein